MVFVIWGFAVGAFYAWLHNVLHGSSRVELRQRVLFDLTVIGAGFATNGLAWHALSK